MPSREICVLLSRIRETYGENSIKPYGTSSIEEHGAGFLIVGVPAIFSVHTQDGTLPPNRYDIQIESSPPGNYLYTGIVTLDEFMQLVTKITGPEEDWPTQV